MTVATIWLHDDKRRDLFPQIAAIHAEQLKAGLLASFAPQVLERLYRRASTDPLSILVVSFDETGTVTGFVMGSLSPFRFYLGSLMRIWPWLALEVWRRPQIIGRAASLGKYAFAPKRLRGPGAELLSIAVRADDQHSGVGAELLRQFRMALLALDEKSFRVTASDTQKAARKFYRKHGGVVISETDLGGLRSFTYEMPA